MHILFISQYFRPELGAASERISGHAVNLAKFGHEVTVITGFPNYPGGKVYPGYRRKPFSVEVIEGVRVVRVWLWTTTKKGAASRLLNYLSFMLASTIAGIWLGKMDRVVATSGPIFAGLSGYIVSAIKRAPFILDIRDIWPERIYAGTKLKRGRLLGLLERLEVFLYRKAERIIAVTRGVKENIVSKGISPEKVTVITNGVDTALFSTKTRDRVLADKLGLGENEFIVIYAGTLGLLQDVDLIVECARRLNQYGDIVFLLVGDGPRRDEIVRMAKKNNMENMRVLPPVPPEELCDYINLSSLGINTNTTHPHNEMAIPVKIFCYMACGKPVVLANAGEIADMVEKHNIGRCIPPGDAGAFTNAVLEFYNDRQLCSRCGENGRRLAEERFRTEVLSRELEKIL